MYYMSKACEAHRLYCKVYLGHCIVLVGELKKFKYEQLSWRVEGMQEMIESLELSDILYINLGDTQNQRKEGRTKDKQARINRNEQEPKQEIGKNKRDQVRHAAKLSQRTAMPRFVPQKESNLDEIIGAIRKAKTAPVHRIGIEYGKKKRDGQDAQDAYDPTDSAQQQRNLKDKVYITDRLDIYFLDKEKRVTFDFSYFGSGVMKDAYHTTVDEFRAAANKWDTAPTPEQAGKLLMRILGEAVMRAGDHIDPDTKERMLFWMNTSEGAVWRVFYEMMAPIKTVNYNFTKVS